MVYQIPSSSVKLAQVFRLLEEKKDLLDIEGYSVSQTTLDDVWICISYVFLFISALFHIGIYSFCQPAM